jgi:hypothetical protein
LVFSFFPFFFIFFFIFFFFLTGLGFLLATNPNNGYVGFNGYWAKPEDTLFKLGAAKEYSYYSHKTKCEWNNLEISLAEAIDEYLIEARPKAFGMWFSKPHSLLIVRLEGLQSQYE